MNGEGDQGTDVIAGRRVKRAASRPWRTDTTAQWQAGWQGREGKRVSRMADRIGKEKGAKPWAFYSMAEGLGLRTRHMDWKCTNGRFTEEAVIRLVPDKS